MDILEGGGDAILGPLKRSVPDRQDLITGAQRPFLDPLYDILLELLGS